MCSLVTEGRETDGDIPNYLSVQRKTKRRHGTAGGIDGIDRKTCGHRILAMLLSSLEQGLYMEPQKDLQGIYFNEIKYQAKGKETNTCQDQGTVNGSRCTKQNMEHGLLER